MCGLYYNYMVTHVGKKLPSAWKSPDYSLGQVVYAVSGLSMNGI